MMYNDKKKFILTFITIVFGLKVDICFHFGFIHFKSATTVESQTELYI